MCSPRSWTVVIFEEDETVQAVPTKWILREQCLWPTLPREKFNVALKNCDYSSCWPSHKIRILRNSTFGDYSLARSKARKAEFTSDLSTDTEGHRKRNKKLFSSSDSDEDSFNKKKKKPLRSLPPPPQMSSNKQCSLEKFNEEEISTDNTTTKTTRRSPVNRTIVEILENTPKQILTGWANSPGTSSQAHTASEYNPSSEARSTIPTMRERSTTSCRNLCDVCCNKPHQEAKSLYVISSLLVELNGKLDRLLKSEVRVGAVNETGILVKTNIEFPIGSVLTFEKFNLFLEEQENYSGLVKYFSKIGGNNLTEFVKRCLAPLIKDDLAMQFTYLGRKGNLNFGVSNLAKAIVDAIDKTNLMSSRKETEISIGALLKRAPERKRRSTILI